MTKLLSVALILGAIFALPALPALSQFSQGQYTTNDIAELKKYAEKGNPEAQIKLGFAYAEASGVPEDRREAVKWWRMAAKQGHVDAQLLLGRSYASGQGVPQNYKRAVEWLRLAAEQGNPYAQEWLQNNKNSAKTRDKFFKEAYSYSRKRDNTDVIMSYVIGVAQMRIDSIEEEKLKALAGWIDDHLGRREIKDKDLSVAGVFIGINARSKEGFRREFHMSNRVRRAGQTFTDAINGLSVTEKNEPLALERGMRVRNYLITLFRRFCTEDPTKLTYDEMALILRRQGVDVETLNTFIMQEKEMVIRMVREPIAEHYREIDYQRAKDEKMDARFEELFNRLAEEISSYH